MDQEFAFDENTSFVLHDSKGFERLKSDAWAIAQRTSLPIKIEACVE